MVAQSLDLPPSAARWRHQQRRASQTQPRRASHFPLAVVPWNNNGDATGPGQHGGAAEPGAEDGLLQEQGLDPPRDVRSRVAGMLQNERGSGGGWDSDDEGSLG